LGRLSRAVACKWTASNEAAKTEEVNHHEQ